MKINNGKAKFKFEQDIVHNQKMKNHTFTCQRFLIYKTNKIKKKKFKKQ